MIEIILFCGVCIGVLLVCERWLLELGGGRIEDGIDEFVTHIKVLIKVSIGKEGRRWLRIFFGLSIGLFVLTILLLSGRVSSMLALLSGLFLGTLPYIALRLKLKVLQVESSREGEILVTELLENYKIHYFNMQRAIEQCADGLGEAPNCRRLLYNLSRGLNAAGSPEDIRRLLDEFRFSINTSWANILAVNMYFALSGGLQVTYALTDLSSAVAMARRVDEYVKRENNEAKLMLKYLAPICYVLTIAGGIAFFGLTWKKFLYYQFQTSVGLTWFVISLLLYVSGIIVYFYISRGKLDL